LHIADILAGLPEEIKPSLTDDDRYLSIDILKDAQKGQIRAKSRNVLKVFADQICDMIVRTEMMRTSFSHEELSNLYTLSCTLQLSDVNVLHSLQHLWIVYIGFSVEDAYETDIPSDLEGSFDQSIEMGKTYLCTLIDLKSYLDKTHPGFTEKTDFESFMQVYRYIVYTLTSQNQNTTLFIHIDDINKVKDSLKFVDACVAANNYTEIYKQFPSTAIQAGLGPLTIPEKIYYRGQVSRFSGGKWVFGAQILPKEFQYPELSLKTAESDVYVLFAFLMRTQDICTLDTETTGLDVLSVSVVSVGLAFDCHLGFYISLDHRQTKGRKLYIGEKGLLRRAGENAYVLRNNGLIQDSEGAGALANLNGDNLSNIPLSDFKSVLMASLSKKKLIYHNAKYDYSVLYHQTGVRFPIYFDTMIAHYVARPGYDDRILDKRGLQFIAVKELKINPWKSDITKCQCEHKDLAAAYNTRDCCYTQAISFKIWPDLKRIHKLFFEIEMPFVEIIAHAEMSGICVDKDILVRIEGELNEKMGGIADELKDLSEREDFNINSGPHLSTLFFEKMQVVPVRKCKKCMKLHQEGTDLCPNCGGLSPIKRVTGAGKPSLDKVALEDLAKLGIPSAQKILEYRMSKKLTSSYTNMWQKAHPFDGHIHPSYHQTSTATGRLSCSNPNFQQLPKRTAKYIREAIKPKPGDCLIGADYSGQEIRIMAAYSGDEKLIKAYNPCHFCEHNNDGRGEFSKFGTCEFETHKDPNSRCNVIDIHSYVTAQVYKDIIDVPVTQIKDHPVWDMYRTRCKAVTFNFRGTQQQC